MEDGAEEYEVEEILKERTKMRGRTRQRQFLVKWTGYAGPIIVRLVSLIRLSVENSSFP